MTVEEILKERNQKYMNWMNEVCTEIELPEDAVDKFGECLMSTKPSDIKLGSAPIRDILSRRHDTLSRFQVGIVVNVILNTPPNFVYTDLEDYLKNGIRYRDVAPVYNALEKDKKDQLDKEVEAKKRILRN